MPVKLLGTFALLIFIIQCSTTRPRATRPADTLQYYRKVIPEKKQALETFLQQKLPLMKGRKACLVSNQAGMGRLLYTPATSGGLTGLHERFKSEGVELYKVFTPEHGLSAVETAHGNETGEEDFYLKTIYFLTVSQIAELFKGCEDMIYSLPDAGVRPFTYRTIFTRTIRAFEKSRRSEAPKSTYYFIDVPNPATHLKSIGPVAHSFSYLGEEEIPFLPGYTFGELARYFHARHKLKVKLDIQPVEAYDPAEHFLTTAYPYVQPSPNLPTFRSMECYWAAVFLEGNVLDLGRNSNDPFCLLGHPDFKVHKRPADGNGVQWQTYRYIPWGGKFKGQLITAYRMNIVEPAEYQPVRTAYQFVRFMQQNYSEIKMWRVSNKGVYWLDKLVGGKSMRRALQNNVSFEKWYAQQEDDIEEFRATMGKFKLYE